MPPANSKHNAHTEEVGIDLQSPTDSADDIDHEDLTSMTVAAVSTRWWRSGIKDVGGTEEAAVWRETEVSGFSHEKRRFREILSTCTNI